MDAADVAVARRRTFPASHLDSFRGPRSHPRRLTRQAVQRRRHAPWPEVADVVGGAGPVVVAEVAVAVAAVVVVDQADRDSHRPLLQ